MFDDALALLLVLAALLFVARMGRAGAADASFARQRGFLWARLAVNACGALLLAWVLAADAAVLHPAQFEARSATLQHVTAPGDRARLATHRQFLFAGTDRRGLRAPVVLGEAVVPLWTERIPLAFGLDGRPIATEMEVFPHSRAGLKGRVAGDFLRECTCAQTSLGDAGDAFDCLGSFDVHRAGGLTEARERVRIHVFMRPLDAGARMEPGPAQEWRPAVGDQLEPGSMMPEHEHVVTRNRLTGHGGAVNSLDAETWSLLLLPDGDGVVAAAIGLLLIGLLRLRWIPLIAFALAGTCLLGALVTRIGIERNVAILRAPERHDASTRVGAAIHLAESDRFAERAGEELLRAYRDDPDDLVRAAIAELAIRTNADAGRSWAAATILGESARDPAPPVRAVLEEWGR